MYATRESRDVSDKDAIIETLKQEFEMLKSELAESKKSWVRKVFG